jgi:hypothetical protein
MVRRTSASRSLIPLGGRDLLRSPWPPPDDSDHQIQLVSICPITLAIFIFPHLHILNLGPNANNTRPTTNINEERSYMCFLYLVPLITGAVRTIFIGPVLFLYGESSDQRPCIIRRTVRCFQRLSDTFVDGRLLFVRDEHGEGVGLRRRSVHNKKEHVD